MNAHPITRADLYELVWQKPVTQAAKQFGVSDVGLRKICSKHDIPTPPLGYWAKLAHGKKVYKPPLPPLRNGISDRIYVTGRPFTAIPDSVAAAAAGARDRESAPENRIKVESERPEKLHRIAAAVEKAVRKAKPDDEGFKTVRGAGLVEMSVGTESAPRAIRMLDAVLKAATARSHAIVEEDGGVRLSSTTRDSCCAFTRPRTGGRMYRLPLIRSDRRSTTTTANGFPRSTLPDGSCGRAGIISRLAGSPSRSGIPRNIGGTPMSSAAGTTERARSSKTASATLSWPSSRRRPR